MNDVMSIAFESKIKNIRIHHEFEDGIEKFSPRITDWDHKVSQVMTNGDGKGWIFIPILTQIVDSFSCSPLNAYFILENMKKASRKS